MSGNAQSIMHDSDGQTRSDLTGHEPVSNDTGALGIPTVDREASCEAGEKGGLLGRKSGMEKVSGYRLPDCDRMRQERLATLEETVGAVDELLFEASVASFGPESVIGEDDRAHIAATSSLPWRWICSLLVTARTGSRFIGTGWFIGPRTVMTAGHVVFMHDEGGWAQRITVIPGRNGSERPFGSLDSSALRSVSGWTQNRDTNFDYGAIIMPDDSLGSQVGHFGFAALTDATLNGLLANLSGYPGDKPAGTQWFHARNITSVSPQKVFYDVDTFGGQSGSPVWRLRNGQRTAVAIHTTGGGGTLPNSGTRINTSVFNNMDAWQTEGAESAR